MTTSRDPPHLKLDESATRGDTERILVPLDAIPPSRPLPGRLVWAPAARRLLEEM